MQRYGVTVHTGVDVSEQGAAAVAGDADMVVLAAGAGWQAETNDAAQWVSGDDIAVVSVLDVLRAPAALAGPIAAVDMDGFVQGPGIAELIAVSGHDVVLATPLTELGGEELERTRQRSYIARRLADAGVTVKLGASAPVDKVAAARTVVLVTPPRPGCRLRQAFGRLGVAPHVIGDCQRPGPIGAAVEAGRALAMRL